MQRTPTTAAVAVARPPPAKAAAAVPWPAAAPHLWQPDLYPDAHIVTLGLDGDAEARRLLRRALRQSWPAARRFGWHVGVVSELESRDQDVGYTGKDGTVYVKLRDPAKGRRGGFYSYGFVLATLLHELTHLSVLGHSKVFYKRLMEAVMTCRLEAALRQEVHGQICAELLNAVCDNDARRARGLLAVLPEAVHSPLSGVGNQLPLEYAAHHGRVALTKLLLESRADADATCRPGGVPPLALAAAQGNCKTAKLLLDAGATRGRAALERSSSASGGGCGCPVLGDDEDEDEVAAAAGLRRPQRRPQEPRRAESLPALYRPARSDVSAASSVLSSERSSARGQRSGRRPG